MLIYILQKGRPITQLPKRAQRDVLADNDEVGGESSPREHCSFRPWRWPVAGGRRSGRMGSGLQMGLAGLPYFIYTDVRSEAVGVDRLC